MPLTQKDFQDKQVQFFIKNIVTDAITENINEIQKNQIKLFLEESRRKYLEPEIIERIIRVEEEQKSLAKRFEFLIDQMDKRFEQVDKRLEQIDKRFESMQQQVDKRFDSMQQQIDKRCEQVDKQFEQVNKRFESMQQQMDKRFDALTRRIDRFMIWSFATTTTFSGIIIAVIKFL